MNSRRFAPFSASLNTLIQNVANTGRGSKQFIGVMSDMSMSAFCLWSAYSLRLGLPFSDFRATWYLFIGLPVLTALIFGGLGIYRWVIRSSNQLLYKQLIKGCVLSALVLLITLSLIPPDRINPRSLFVIYGFLLISGTACMRMIWKSLFDSGRRGEPVAIYGAGSAGRQLAGLLREGHDYRPKVFIDDNSALEGATLSGLPVLNGGDLNLRSDLKRHDVESIVLAMPSMGISVYQNKLAQIDELGFYPLTMPSVGELMSGKIRADEIRDVSINDILGRQEVSPNVELMARNVTDKTVLVTGGGGSIGSEICRQVVKHAPKRIVVLDNCEENLYYITEELNALLKSRQFDCTMSFDAILGSVTDSKHLAEIFGKFNIDTVFHAAAYKHVPIVEAQPEKGVEVNVLGTLRVLDAAIESKVASFVLISTDKAVRPANAMGGTKRIAELILQAKARQKHSTNICMVRFGNVLGSSGSVVPKFKKQITEGGPITLTHRDITRYFMTIPEAAQLVMQAGSIAKGGDVFVLDMGEPVLIEDLAATMVRLYGKQLRRDTGDPNDIEIVEEGLRPGEKMYEELFLGTEPEQTIVPKISTAREQWLEWGELQLRLKRLLAQDERTLLKEQIHNLAYMEPSNRTLGDTPGSDEAAKVLA